jgi:hypothetical protein
MKKNLIFSFVILTLVLAACATKAPPYATVAPSLAYNGASSDSAQGNVPAPAEAFGVQKTAGGVVSTTAAQDRLVIMNADVTIVIPDPQAKMDAIMQLANSLGGFVISMNMGQTYTPTGETVPQGTISIRVPANQLDNALKQIKAGAIDVQNEDRNGQDVTAQYTDLQSQLNNLEQAERDLIAIMDEAKNNPNSSTTSQTQDVLAVYNQIVQVRGQIEQIKGQMQYFEQSSSYSLINVTLIAEKTIQPIQKIGRAHV